MTGHGQELVVVVVVVEGPQRRPEKSSAQLLRRELLLTVKLSAPGKMRGFPTSKSETTRIFHTLEIQNVLGLSSS